MEIICIEAAPRVVYIWLMCDDYDTKDARYLPIPPDRNPATSKLYTFVPYDDNDQINMAHSIQSYWIDWVTNVIYDSKVYVLIRRIFHWGDRMRLVFDVRIDYDWSVSKLDVMFSRTTAAIMADKYERPTFRYYHDNNPLVPLDKPERVFSNNYHVHKRLISRFDAHGAYTTGLWYYTGRDAHGCRAKNFDESTRMCAEYPNRTDTRVINTERDWTSF